MSLNLVDLDEQTRTLMLAEIESDTAANRLYLSPRLSASGQAAYAERLKEAATHYDDSWLAAQLRAGGLLNTQEPKRTPKGGMTTAKVPVTAADTLAEGEFNRFYIRALCVRAEQEGIADLIVYRAKHSEHPRAASEQKIGSSVPARKLLDDLRSNPGVDTALGLPAGPNSGLSVKLQ